MSLIVLRVCLPGRGTLARLAPRPHPQWKRFDGAGWLAGLRHKKATILLRGKLAGALEECDTGGDCAIVLFAPGVCINAAYRSNDSAN